MPTRHAYFQGNVVPLEQAKIGVMTHAFNYGTAVFEGIRGNWNPDDQTVYLFRVREHMERLVQSAKILTMEVRDSVDRLCDLSVEIVERSGFAEDVYLRPMVYLASEQLGVRLHNLQSDTLIFLTPFPAYLPEVARCHTSTWRRVDDTGIPPRAKVTGIYVNSALAKTEANLNGFDEAIMLNADGHVSEGSGENIFMVRHGKLITPTPADNILEGITAQSVVELAAKELGVETIQRQIDRTELYIADEIFMTGTAAHLTPVTEVDRRVVGSGRPGPITSRLSQLFFDCIRGKNEKYRHWCTPARVPVAQ
ncbi:MAG: branched-chain amino acid transaminase [Dehalococcoidia bacterium]|nr:branched-chain amino acid transaminase [Dehalococcoidia bacterium]MCL4232423.1 branched-chain amino acid transaminase [Dehalococcoidia bacterium]NUQ54386.1 branched-chain amino acid transaminase [Dehalococcoidia bacterium]RIL04336.1 MAG: branched chain amino acid aminotransferase [bacterium]